MSGSELPRTPPGTAASRCGYVALVGRPNAGKSTLFNAFLGQRLSIVTARPQTTRDRILGVLTTDAAQIIFLDTPGLLEPSYKLHERMGQQIDRAAADADAVLLLIDATVPWDRRKLVDSFISRCRSPLLAVLNKTDAVPPGRVASLASQVKEGFGLAEVLPISALTGDWVDVALSRLVSLLPLGPHLYPEDVIAEQPERFFVAELIREAAFQQLSDELPYAINVSVDEFTDPRGTGDTPIDGVTDEALDSAADERRRGSRKGSKTYVGATIYVERDSQKGIVIGRKGTRLRSIGQEARQRIEGLLERPVYLELWVKVRADWRDRDRDLHEFGYL